MERENKKRGREEEDEKAVSDLNNNNEKKKSNNNKKKKHEISAGYSSEDIDIFDVSDTYRPLAVFEFPWQKKQGEGEEKDGGQGQDQNLVVSSESDGGSWDFRDVFFSSLVDGCSAKIEFPGDRLCGAPNALSLSLLPRESSDDGSSWPSEEEIDGLDCFWSSVLSQPMSAGSSKIPNA